MAKVYPYRDTGPMMDVTKEQILSISIWSSYRAPIRALRTTTTMARNQQSFERPLRLADPFKPSIIYAVKKSSRPDDLHTRVPKRWYPPMGHHQPVYPGAVQQPTVIPVSGVPQTVPPQPVHTGAPMAGMPTVTHYRAYFPSGSRARTRSASSNSISEIVVRISSVIK